MSAQNVILKTVDEHCQWVDEFDCDDEPNKKSVFSIDADKFYTNADFTLSMNEFCWFSNSKY